MKQSKEDNTVYQPLAARLRPENIDLGRVNVPVLVVTNLADQCSTTRPESIT